MERGHTLFRISSSPRACCLFGSFGLSFFGGSLSFGLGCCCGSCGFCFFLGDFFSLSLVLGYFGFETLLCRRLTLVFVGCLYGCIFSIFLGFPSVEATFCLCLIECAFLNTAQEVVHQQYAFVRKNGANGVGGLGTGCYPIQSTLEIKSNCSRISVRIIGTYPFNKSTISWCPAIGDNNRIERIVLATMTLQSNFCCHLECFVIGLFLMRRKSTSFF